MRSQALRTGILLLVGIAAITLFAAMFTVHQTQQALVLRFGAVRKVLTEPGLYFKVPLVETVHYVDKRVLDLDLPVQTILSTDRQNLEVDAFARYRITDPLRFYQSVNNIQNANARLTSFVNSSLRNVLAGATTTEIIRTRRGELMNHIQEILNRQARELGIEIVDVRLTRVDLPAANSQAVFQRMQTERQREAADIRAHGQQEALGIRARADREATVIVAEAGRQADQLRGQGDGEKNRILAEAFGRDPDFFTFYRSMQAYENGLRPNDTRMVLSPNSNFFRYFNDPSGRTPAGNGGAPVPGNTGSLGAGGAAAR
jgi:modulator of FtsH protease HflC